MKSAPASALADLYRRASASVDSRIKDLQDAGPYALQLLATTFAAGVVLIMIMAFLFTPYAPPLNRIAYSDFKQHLGQVREISTSGRNIDGVFATTIAIPGAGSVLTFTTQMPAYGDPNLEAMLEQDGVRINDPSEPFSWDVVLSAMPFATLAAVLAGFVIVSVVAMLTFPPNVGDTSTQHAPLIPFLAAFFTLLLAAFLFSVLAGTGSSGGNRLLPLVEAYALSWVLGCGVVQMTVGIAWLMDDYSIAHGARTVRQAARVIVHLAVVVTAIAAAGILVQSLFVLDTDNGWKGAVAWLVIGVMPPIAAIAIGRYFRATRDMENLGDTTYVAIAMVVIVMFGYGYVSTFTEQAVRASYTTVFTLMVTTQLLLCALFAAYEATIPRLESKEIEPSSTPAPQIPDARSSTTA